LGISFDSTDLDRRAHLDHGIPLNVILEALELEVKNGRERLENYSLLRILEAISFCLILVLSIKRLNRNIVSKRLVKILHSFDIKLQICERVNECEDLL